MFKEGEFVVYKRDVCKIITILRKHLNGEDYYRMVPLSDESLKIDVPIQNKLGLIRPLLTKTEVENLIKRIPNIKTIDIPNKMIENEYKSLIKDNSHESLIKIIKTTYRRNQQRIDNKRKIGDKDDYYFRLAEKYLYNELSLVLNLSIEETKKYIIQEVSKNEQK